MKIKQFNPSTLDQYRKTFIESVKELEEKTGVKIDMGKMRYDATGFTSTVTFTIVGEGENPQEVKDRKTLADYGRYYDLSEEDYGAEFKNGQNELVKLVALNPKAKKYPIIYELNGKRYKAPISRLDAYLSNRAVKS